MVPSVANGSQPAPIGQVVGYDGKVLQALAAGAPVKESIDTSHDAQLCALAERGPPPQQRMKTVVAATLAKATATSLGILSVSPGRGGARW